jgi:hypothetical protein
MINYLIKILFLFFLILAGWNIAAEPALSQTASPTFNTFYENYEKNPTEPASLVVIIIPQDLAGKEIYGVEAYYQTDQYQLPAPFSSNFNINFQGWGVGDWTCNIGQKSLACQGGTALKSGKKTIVAMYFSDNIVPPNQIVANVLDSNGGLIDTIKVGSTPALTNQESLKEPIKESSKEEVTGRATAESVKVIEGDQPVQIEKQLKAISWGAVGAVVATSAVVLSVGYLIIRIKKLLRRKKGKTSKQCSTCRGTGKIKKLVEQEKQVKCPNCQKVPFERCPYCGGTGKSSEAAQWAMPKSKEEMKFLPPCDWCEGTGFKLGGAKKGMIPPFTGAKCTICKGRGYTVQKQRIEKEEICPTCKGKGAVPA